MSPDPLDLIWRCADAESPLLAGDENGVRSSGASQSLTGLGLLRAGKTASHVTCDACDEEHVERVETVKYPDGRTRFFIRCPQNGRIEVDRERLLQWSVDFTPVLTALAEGLGIRVAPEEVVPGRVWKLGRTSIAGRSRVAWVARGLSRPDAQELAEHLPTGKSPLLFLLGLAPENGAVNLRPDSVAEVRDVISLSGGRLLLDRKAVEDQLCAAPDTAPKKTAKKRASRAATIEALQKEMTEHIIAARDHAHAAIQRGEPPDLLPRPQQKDLAARLGVDESAVSRALRDPSAHMLKVLWNTAQDLDQILKFRPSRRH